MNELVRGGIVGLALVMAAAAQGRDQGKDRDDRGGAAPEGEQKGKPDEDKRGSAIQSRALGHRSVLQKASASPEGIIECYPAVAKGC